MLGMCDLPQISNDGVLNHNPTSIALKILLALKHPCNGKGAEYLVHGM
jgi:hypothetical protein